MKRVVADCSVLVKLFIPEEGSVAIREYLEHWKSQNFEVWIPELAMIEHANVMWQKVRKKELSLPLARSCISDFIKLPFQIARHAEIVEASFRLASELNITAYDACYVALAHRLRASFCTADKKLALKLKDSSVAVELIE